jgi:hypothetical protein
MHPLSDTGQPLRATFSVSQQELGGEFVLHFESRGPGRNEDYLPALELLLRRLASLSAVVQRAAVASQETDSLPMEQRTLGLSRPYPLPLASVPDLGRLRREISRAQERTGARAGATGGNPTKRIELALRLPDDGPNTVAWLEAALAGSSTAGDYEAVQAAVRPTPRRRGQGWGLSPAEKQAVENYAMRRATAYFEKHGYRVDDVHKTWSYDLDCVREDGRHLIVEVKGTTGADRTVLVTRNEVNLAKRSHPNTALYLLSDISLTRAAGGLTSASGGRERVLLPWDISKCGLTPMTFECELPASGAADFDSADVTLASLEGDANEPVRSRR